MLDIAWPELVVIGAVALVAIGPKDLPKAMHILGKWIGKARSFAHEVHRTIEQVSYEAEIAEKLKRDEAKAKEFEALSTTLSPHSPPPSPPPESFPAEQTSVVPKPDSHD